VPNRILRDGILSSEGVNSLGWAEEVFYRRLMSVVDDFGRYYASPKLLRAACYPLQIDKVSDSDIGKWLTACVTAALVRVYPASDGKRYIELLNFRQQARAKASKFPEQHGECIADAMQMLSNGVAHAPVFGDVSVFGDGGVVQPTVAPARPAAEHPVLALVEPPKPKGPPDCPHGEILALWAETLPALPQHLPDQWRGTRADHLRTRWRETATAKGWTEKDQGLAYFRRLFGYVGQSQFLTGRSTSRDPNKRPFVVELEWLVLPSNWAKVHEGKYHPEAAAK
jgi:hypothetical protein